MFSKIFSFIRRLFGLGPRRSEKYDKRLLPGEIDMSNKVVLRYEELRVLQAFGHLDEVAIPQLALEARLTPTEMSEVVSRLASKNLVRTGNGYFAHLTKFGAAARENFVFDTESLKSSLFKLENHHPQPSTSSTLEAEKTV